MDCPTCGKSLETEQGVRIHHTKVHGTTLPNRVCKGCNADFYDPDSKRSYCEECNPNAGSNNGNWKGAKEESECEICGQLFEYYPSNKKGVFCPSCVDESTVFLGDQFVKKAEHIDKECEYCGTMMEVLQSEISNGRGKFCSQTCLSGWMSENRVGENHHQWEGGEIEYGQNWWRIRRKALQRDEYTCQQCGATKPELGRNPDVHHIKRVRDFEKPQSAHTLDNVISLCRSCHRNVEEGNVPTPEIL